MRDHVWDRFGEPDARLITDATPELLGEMQFAPGSMRPKVEAVVRFEYPARLFPALIIRSFERMAEIVLVRRDAALLSVTTETSQLGNDRAATRILASWTIAASGPAVDELAETRPSEPSGNGDLHDEFGSRLDPA